MYIFSCKDLYWPVIRESRPEDENCEGFTNPRGKEVPQRKEERGGMS
jgi:hypothetical protein